MRQPLFALTLLLLTSPFAAGQQTPTTIRGEIIETPDERAIWKRTFTVLLLGKNDIRETWSNVRIDKEMGAVSGNNWNGSSTLGAQTPSIAWRVLGEHRLQRVAKHGDGLITLMTLDIDANGRCHIDRRYLNRRDAGVAGAGVHFRTISAHCSIE